MNLTKREMDGWVVLDYSMPGHLTTGLWIKPDDWTDFARNIIDEYLAGL